MQLVSVIWQPAAWMAEKRAGCAQEGMLWVVWPFVTVFRPGTTVKATAMSASVILGENISMVVEKNALLES